jgi:hypothetical protein
VGAEAESLGDDLVHVGILTCVTDDSQIDTPAPALKEWAVICHALLTGEQILDVRKGGIREERRDTGGGGARRSFAVPATRCWLYPTAEHQRAELLKPPYRHWIDLAGAAPVGDAITIRGWAEIVEVATISEADELAAIESKLIWTGDYAASRLSWKPRDPLWVLAMRAFRLVEPVTVDWSEDYRGCTSWVTLAGLPADPATLPSEPALSDVAFEARLKGAREAVPSLAPPAV